MMVSQNRLRIRGTIVAVSLVGVACGQLPGVDQSFRAGAPVAPGQAPAPGQPVVPVEPVAPGEPGAPGVPAAGEPAAPQATVPEGGGDTTGVTEKKITIGIHAPVTGAAPIESDVFRAGKDLYWKWLEDQGESIFGRSVEVLFRDDRYSPQHAANVCQEMAEQNNAFLLIGGAGTDQIAACARYANGQGIPYLSAGVTEQGLLDFRTYFASSASYRAQGPLVAQMIVNKFGRSRMDVNSVGGAGQPDGALRVAFVIADSPNFEDAEQGFREGLEAEGFDTQSCDNPTGDCYKLYRLPKTDSPTLQPAVRAAVQDMQQNGIDVVNTLIAPVVVVQVVQEADSRGYAPRWVAPGVSTVNTVADFLCDANPNTSYDGADVFFPWPGWREVKQGKFDPTFQGAVEEFTPQHDNLNDGDLLLSLWSISKVLHQMFAAAGPNLSRESFIAALEQEGPFNTGLNPTLRYQPSEGGHWGTSAVHLLEARCHQGHGEFHTVEAFARGWK